MNFFVVWLLQNEEWVFSGLGVFVFGLILTEIRSLLKRPAALRSTEEKADSPLDPNISSDEVKLLRRFCGFPRTRYTQGYQVDYIRKLAPDVAENTLMIFLDSLFLKGYLAKHRTNNGNHTYYQLSHDAVRYLVNNNIVTLDAQQAARIDGPASASLRRDGG
jgi:hypothetical protein